MPKNTIADYSATAASNTDIQGVDIDEGCAPSGINNAIRELMADLADVDAGTVALTSPNLTAFSIGGTAVTATAAELNILDGVTATAAQLNEAGSFADTFTLPTADGTSGQVLQTNGSGVLSFATGGSGDVTGPSSVTDWEIPRFNGTTGKLLEGSGAVINQGTDTMIIVREGEETGGSSRVLFGADNWNTSAGTGNNNIISFGSDTMRGWNTIGSWNGGGAFFGQNNATWPQGTGSPTISRFPEVCVGHQNLYYRIATTSGVTVDAREAVFVGTENGGADSGTVGTTQEFYAAIGIGAGNIRAMGSGNFTGSYNIGIGETNLQSSFTGSGTTDYQYNIGIGNSNLKGYISSTYNASYERNIAIGSNCMSGYNNGAAATVTYNTAVGHSAMSTSGSGTSSNNTAIGYQAGTTSSPSGNLAGNSNKIVLGNNNITNAYIKVSWTVTSDERDKADKTNFDLGLDQINQINPIAFKWDMRSDYFVFDENGEISEKPVPDGTHKQDQQYLGFSAQELKTIFDAAGAPAKTIVDDSDAENLKLKESALLPVMVNAIKQLSAKCDSLQAQIDAMGA